MTKSFALNSIFILASLGVVAQAHSEGPKKSSENASSFFHPQVYMNLLDSTAASSVGLGAGISMADLLRVRVGAGLFSLHDSNSIGAEADLYFAKTKLNGGADDGTEVRGFVGAGYRAYRWNDFTTNPAAFFDIFGDSKVLSTRGTYNRTESLATVGIEFRKGRFLAGIQVNAAFSRSFSLVESGAAASDLSAQDRFTMGGFVGAEF